MRCRYEMLIGTKEIIFIVNGWCVSNRTNTHRPLTPQGMIHVQMAIIFCFVFSFFLFRLASTFPYIAQYTVHGIDQPFHNLRAAHQRQTVELGTFQCYLCTQSVQTISYTCAVYRFSKMSIRPHIIRCRRFG